MHNISIDHEPYAETFFLENLRQHYPNPIILLTYNTAFELLIKVMMSAQCSDAQVNNVAASLFEQYPTAKDMAEAQQADIARIIHSLGYFNTKSRYCIAIAQHVHELGCVPDDMQKLCSMPGIGRKSASVILYTVYKRPALIVDRHVARVSARIGISAHPKDVSEAERQLASLFRKDAWGEISMLLNYHGRYCCKARAPECDRCRLAPHCQFAQTPMRTQTQ